MSKKHRRTSTPATTFLGQAPRFSQPLRAPVPVSKLMPIVADAIPPDRALVASVRRFGVVTPVVLLNLNDGEGDRLVDGRRRVLAAKEAGLDHVEALIYRLDPDEGRRFFPPEVLTLALNELRRPNPVAEAEAIRRLMDRGATLRDICRITGLPPVRVQRRMRLLRLSAPLAEALEEGRLAVGVAEAAAKLAPAEQGELAEKLARDGKLTAADVARARDAVRRSALQALPGFNLPLPDVANSPQPAKGKGTPTARDLFRALSLPLQQLVRQELAEGGATWLLDAIK